MAGWRRIEAETRRELYVAVGNLNVSDGGADAYLEELERNARRVGAKVRWLESADLRREFPQFRPGKRALFEEEAGFLRATDCGAALRALGEQAGVRRATEPEARIESPGAATAGGPGRGA